MAGPWPLSFNQFRDPNGEVYRNARALFYQADSLDGLTVYSDYGLGTPLGTSVNADGNGIFPAVFLDEADEFYRFRVLTESGVTIIDLATMPIIGPSGGGGGSEVPVDPNALLVTGDVFWRGSTAARPGAVRCNAKTIGSQSSGATERAHADTEALFLYLWNNFADSLCPVVGGRAGSAAADWASNKQITVHDGKGRGLWGADSMGGSAANRLQGTTFTIGDRDTGGSVAGLDLRAIAQANLPSGITLTGTISGNIIYTAPAVVSVTAQAGAGSGTTQLWQGGNTNAAATSTGSTLTPSIALGGSGTSLQTAPPLIVGGFFLKL